MDILDNAPNLLSTITESGGVSIDQASVLKELDHPVIVLNGGVLVYSNQAANKLLGETEQPQTVFGKSFIDWVHPDDAAKVEVLLCDASSELTCEIYSQDHKFRMCPSLGGLVWVNMRLKPVDAVSDPAGQNVAVGQAGKGYILCLTDITEDYVSRQAQAQSEQMFKRAFQLSPEMMVIIHLSSGEILDVNPAFLNMFGRRRTEVLGKRPNKLNIWADATFYNRFIEEFKMSASQVDVPTTVRVRGNIVRHLRMSAQKIELENQDILLLIGRDVTDDLLQAAELQRSRDSAELANRAKSEFLANMSHELRTPLNAILGFAEILRDEMLGSIGQPRYKEYAGDIHESGTHLLLIINDILDLSKVEAGRLEAHLSWVDPVPALEMCMSLVLQRAIDAEVKLKKRLQLGFELEADERLVKQICLNLLSNAVKFTEPGGEVTLRLEGAVDGGLALIVEDTGIGMSPEEIKIAKRPFGQVDSSISRRHQGSGLGLPLVSAFAEKLRANLRIVSSPGVGTQVIVNFPPSKVRRVEDNPNYNEL